MKIGIIGYHGIGLVLAAHLAERGIQAELVTLPCAKVVPYLDREEMEKERMQQMALSIRKAYGEPVLAFEQPRFNGYMTPRGKLPPQKMKLNGWK
jgi:ketopantoate reductase